VSIVPEAEFLIIKNPSSVKSNSASPGRTPPLANPANAEYSSSVTQQRLAVSNAGQQSGRPSEGDNGGSLGKYAKSTSHAQNGAEIAEKRRLALITRYALQGGARNLLGPSERVAGCHRWRAFGHDDVKCWHIPAATPEGHGGARFEGLQTCGSPWACPVCATTISERRKGDIETALDFAHAQGWAVLMFTYTVPHQIGQSLAQLLGHQARGSKKAGTYQPACGLMGARGLATAGRDMNAVRNADGPGELPWVVGSIRALEVTFGENGWHPHIHELYFVRSDAHLGKLSMMLRGRWDWAVQRVGLGSVNEHGFSMAVADADVAGYVAKFGHDRGWNVEHELAKQVTKSGRAKGRTPSDLLAGYTFEGDIEAGARWREYALTMKGSRQLYWSPGLRSAVGLGAEKSDEEVALASEKVGTWFVRINGRVWQLVVADDVVAQVRWLVSCGDLAAVERFLADYPDMRQGLEVKTWRVELDHSEEAKEARSMGLTKYEYFTWRRGGINAIANVEPGGVVPTSGGRRPQGRKRKEVRKQCDEQDSVFQALTLL
jgi:hypothetical protein